MARKWPIRKACRTFFLEKYCDCAFQILVYIGRYWWLLACYQCPSFCNEVAGYSCRVYSSIGEEVVGYLCVFVTVFVYKWLGICALVVEYLCISSGIFVRICV